MAALWSMALLPTLVFGAATNFNVPSQSAAQALLQFSQQAGVEVLFSFDDLRAAQSTAVAGNFEPEEALNRLLRDTGYYARRSSRGKFVVTRLAQPTGSIIGRLALPDGAPGRDIRVTISDTGQSVQTEATGEFNFPSIKPGTYRLVVTTTGYRPLEIVGVRVDPQPLDQRRNAHLAAE
jgi:iron complex outermembrane recepter protein